MISLKELHLQLQRDVFYGFPPRSDHALLSPLAVKHAVAEAGAYSTVATLPVFERASEAELILLGVVNHASRRTHAASVIERIYRDTQHIEQVKLFRREFGWKFFKDDIHRELVYLWCSFLGLPIYRDGKPLDWDWRDFIKHWDADFAVKKDELREFLRRQMLPLPAYFYFDEPDTTATIKDLPIAWAPDSDRAQPLAEQETRKAKTRAKYQQWQARLDQLRQMPAHRGKTKEQLCTIIAKELIAQGDKPSYIARRTRMPREKSK